MNLTALVVALAVARSTQHIQVNGLVHISQLADEFVANCDDHVKEGDTVRLDTIPDTREVFAVTSCSFCVLFVFLFAKVWSQKQTWQLLEVATCWAVLVCRQVAIKKLCRWTEFDLLS